MKFSVVCYLFLLIHTGGIFVCHGYDLECGHENMTIYFEKDQDFRVTQTAIINFKDTNCTSTENSTHFILTSPYNDCGITSSMTADHIVFTGTVEINPNKKNIMIERSEDVPSTQVFNCNLNRHVNVTIQEGFGKWSIFNLPFCFFLARFDIHSRGANLMER